MMNNKSFFVSLVALFLISVFLPTDSVLSDPKSFTDLDHAKVQDCPDNVDLHATSRVVMQYINGLFYKWKEYDFDDDGAFCIYMQKPERRMLSIDEAKALLEDSAGWIEEPPPANLLKTLDPMDHSLQSVPFEAPVSFDFLNPNGKLSIKQDQPAPRGYPDKALAPSKISEPLPLQRDRTAVGANDTRKRVTETTSFPWNTVGFIKCTFTSDGKMGRGSGAIVAPYMVLTAGHVVYSRDRDEYVGGLNFVPGQHQVSENDDVTQPYGSYAADSWETNSAYMDPDTPDGDRHMYDYGAIFFNRSFTNVGISTCMPIVFDFNPNIDDTVHVAGYPTKVKEETNSYAMWYSSGSLSKMDDSRIKHNAYISPGNSGGPVWLKFSSGQRRLIAINVGYSDNDQNSFSLGCRLAQHNQEIVEEWMSWVPPKDDLTDTHIEGDDSGGCFIAAMSILR